MQQFTGRRRECGLLMRSLFEATLSVCCDRGGPKDISPKVFWGLDFAAKPYVSQWAWFPLRTIYVSVICPCRVLTPQLEMYRPFVPRASGHFEWATFRGGKYTTGGGGPCQ